jgi:hypothetical protein
MAKTSPSTRIGGRANAARPSTAATPNNLGPRSGSGVADTKQTSASPPKGSNSSATGRGNYQDPAHGEKTKKTTEKKTARKLKDAKRTSKPSGKTKAARNLARAGSAVRGSVAGAAVGIAAAGQKAETKARRDAFSKATGKPLDV